MRALNVIAVVLLALIALLVFALPRFNYQALVARQTDVEIRVRTVDDRLSKLDLFADPTKPNRVALLGWIEQAPSVFSDLRESLDMLSGQVSVLTVHQSQIDSRLGAIEGELGALRAKAAPSDPTERLEDHWPTGLSARYLDPIQLPDEISQKAKRLSSGKMSQVKNEEELLDEILRVELVSPDAIKSLSPDAKDRIRQLLEIFQLNYKLIQSDGNLLVQRLVEEKTRGGDFVELPLAPGPIEEEATREIVGITFVKLLRDLGVKRVYQFPVEEFPEIDRLEEFRSIARDHLISDVVAAVRPATNR